MVSGPTPATGLVAHEIAHQWFGNSVTEKDWDDVWLSEGFATYFTLLFTEHTAGREAFVAGLKNNRTRALAAEKANPGIAIIHDNLADMRRVLNGLVYQKAGWVLHMLRDRVGVDAFWSGIREYYRRYRDGNATTDDFRRVMEETSRHELKWFFDQWLRRPVSPSFEGSWRYDAAAKQVLIEIAQTQSGEPYRVTINFGVPGATRSEWRGYGLDMTQKQATFSFPAETEPAAVEFDPHTTLLADRVVFVKR